MIATTSHYLTLLACLAAPLAACGDNATTPDAAVPDAPESFALGALQFTGMQTGRTAVVSTAVDGITLEAWIRWDGGTTGQVVAYNGDSAMSGYGLLVENGNLQLLLGGVDFIKCTSCVLTMGSWTHVAAVRSTGNWAIYQDSVAGTLTAPSTLTPTLPAGMFTAGNSPAGNGGFNGAIDEVRVWNVARSAQEIARARTTALTGGESGLVAYYRLDEGSGALARDATPNQHDLELVGSPSWIRSGAMLTSQ